MFFTPVYYYERTIAIKIEKTKILTQQTHFEPFWKTKFHHPTVHFLTFRRYIFY